MFPLLKLLALLSQLANSISVRVSFQSVESVGMMVIVKFCCCNQKEFRAKHETPSVREEAPCRTTGAEASCEEGLTFKERVL